MLKLPRHVKLYIVNIIQHLDSVEETKELVHEFDCNSSSEADEIVYNFIKEHHIKNHWTEVEMLPIPEQTDEDLYEAFKSCVDASMGEGFIDSDEWHFLCAWLAEHFNIKVKE